MTLYYVAHENDYYPRGRILEELDSGFVQPVHLDKQGRPGVNYGLVVDKRKLRDCIIKLLKNGLDKRW